MYKKKLSNVKKSIITVMLLCVAAFFVEAAGNMPFQEETLTIRGKVLDTDGNPIPGTSVLVKGTSIGTTTDMEGDYTLRNVPRGSTLVFSFIGYVTQEFTVENRTTINAILLEDSQSLDEVTIVAFGTQKRESVTAAITTISAKQLKTPSSNLTTAFGGQLAGMISYQSTGEPGADNADFFIRGVTTFGYNVAPLILVDNIEISKEELARIQPDDIESFSIMKDAAATALYGSRGANGVLLIKTKEGQVGKAKIDLRIENTTSMPTRQIRLADPITYMRMHNEALITRGLEVSPLYSDDKIERTVPGSGSLIYPSNNWQEELLRKSAHNQRVNLSIRGGGDVARYFVSSSFAQDNGILKVDPNNNFNQNIDLKIYTLRSNVNINVTKITELKVSLDGTFEDYTGPLGSGSDMYRLIMRSNPVLFPAKYPNVGEHSYAKHTLFGNFADGTYLNPYAEMMRGYRDYSKFIIGAQLELHQKLDFLAQGLNFRILFNTKRESQSAIARFYTPWYYVLAGYDPYDETDYTIRLINPDADGESLRSTISVPNVVNTTYFESSLSYNTTLDDRHDIGGQLVFTMRHQTIPPIDVVLTSVLGSLPQRNVNFAGRFSYALDGKYLAEVNFGLNGSERFAKSHRWGFFPSASAGWIISREDFFDPFTNVVTNLKLRASYGLSGNDKISDERFLYMSDVNLNTGSNWAFGEDPAELYRRPGISVSRYGMPDVTWEVAYKTNYALEITLFRNLHLTPEFYTERRTSILQQRLSIPYSMGLWNPWNIRANLGEARSRGFELATRYDHVFNSDFWMQGMFNFTYATSWFTKYEDFNYEIETWKHRIGQSTTQAYGYIAEGLFIDDNEVANTPARRGAMAGDIKYRDLNGDGVIDDRDVAPIGYPTTPEIDYGFGASFGWKNWEFSFFFNGKARRSFWIDYNTASPFFNTTGNNNFPGYPVGHNALMQFIADSYWSESNRDPYAVWPRLSNAITTSPQNADRNTWFMRDGAFLRLKKVEIGYNVPAAIARKAGMSGLKIYASATNLFCISKFKIWDVEMAGNGLAYPIQRGYNVGLFINF
jgi:TonB-linked SusC/RagA family outer membrane protein